MRCLVPALSGSFAVLAASHASPQESRGELAEACAPLVAPWVGAGFAPGFVVGVVRGDEVWTQGFGETALGNGLAPDARTLYELGSLTKVYTGLLLADAHLSGVARLDDPLSAHLPDGVAVPAVDGAPIRLVHLSTHSSGLSRLPSNLRAAAADPYASYDAAALYAGLAAARPTRPAGARYEYSNFAVGGLGHALARAWGVESFDALCLARLAVVHGLDDTRVALSPAQLARLAPPHDEALLPGRAWGFDALAAAGGLRASTDDVLRFARLFFDGAQHGHAAAAALALGAHSRAPGGPPVGLGWHHIGGLPGFAAVVGHEGQTGGYHTVLLVAPRERIAVTVLANAPCGELGELGVSLLRRARGEAVAPATFAALAPVPPRALDELPGAYRVGFLDSVTVEAVDGALVLRRSGAPRVRLHAVGGDRYEYRVVPGALEVTRDAAGQVEALVLVSGNQRETARRK